MESFLGKAGRIPLYSDGPRFFSFLLDDSVTRVLLYFDVVINTPLYYVICGPVPNQWNYALSKTLETENVILRPFL